MTIIHLVRHGETVWHEGNRYTGKSDVALTPRGYAQAQELATWAAKTPLSAVASSDLVRAVGTATPAADATGLTLLIDPRLREVDFGDGEGLTAAEMHAAFPAELSNFRARPATSPLPHGEPGTQACARSLQALAELVAEFPDGEVLVVSHSTIIRIMLMRLFGLPIDEYRRLLPRIDNIALNTIRIPAGWMPPDLPVGQPSAALLAFNNSLSGMT
jgi:broad specificity phosphatase PhoE